MVVLVLQDNRIKTQQLSLQCFHMQFRFVMPKKMYGGPMMHIPTLLTLHVDRVLKRNRM